ncbi:SH3 domain-containing protein [Actinokineospora sp. HUAS TT18]|uniref:SH3 domain-containing protein n=1 Tax=Actinokineospora sp. HUAS TT18 TaxID=3447451 RepID=UPI003F51DAEC
MLLVPKTVLIGGAVVAVAYLYSVGGEANGSSPTSGEAKCRVSVTADVLNVRSAPDINAGVVGKFKQGAETDADTAVQNGFRKIGADRWASAEFLKALPGHTC